MDNYILSCILIAVIGLTAGIIGQKTGFRRFNRLHGLCCLAQFSGCILFIVNIVEKYRFQNWQYQKFALYLLWAIVILEVINTWRAYRKTIRNPKSKFKLPGKWAAVLMVVVAISGVLWSAKLLYTGTNYYVDFTLGDEGNSGTQVAPLKYHPWMLGSTSGVVLGAGDIVYMKKGESWTVDNPASHFVTVGASGSSGGGYITTTAYGTGDLPIIKINTATDKNVIYGLSKTYIAWDSLNIKHHSSTYAANRSGIYADGTDTACGYWKVTNCEIEDIPYVCIYGYVNSYNFIIGNENATATATTSLYSNHLHDFGYAGVLLCGRKADTNESNHKVYYNYVHDSTRPDDGDNAYGIAFSCNPTSDGWPVNCWTYYNYISNIETWEGLDCHGGQYLYFRYNYVYNCAMNIMLGSTDYTGFGIDNLADNWYIEYNTLEEPAEPLNGAREIVSISGLSAAYATNVYIRNNEIFFTSPQDAAKVKRGITATNVDGLTIEDCNIYNGNSSNGCYGIQLGSSTPTTVNNYIINRIKVIGFSVPLIIYIKDEASGDCYVTSSILVASGLYNIQFGNAVNLNYSLYLINNTLASTYNGASDAYSIHMNGQVFPDGKYLYCYSNIMSFINSGLGGGYFYISHSSAKYAGNYNLFYNSGDAWFRVYSWRTWAQHQAAGYDANGVNGSDPSFINAGSNDFRLNTGSPAIKTGSATAGQFADLDVQGNGRRTAAPCIGAYEYVKWMGVISPAKINGKNYRVGAGSVK